MIAKVTERKGRLDLLIVSGKHLRRISNRELLQSAHNAEKFITTRKKESFESFAKYSEMTDNLYNDLGIMVGNNKLLLLLEAQSSWTVNILIRILLHLAQSYHE